MHKHCPLLQELEAEHVCEVGSGNLCSLQLLLRRTRKGVLCDESQGRRERRAVGGRVQSGSEKALQQVTFELKTTVSAEEPRTGTPGEGHA